MAPDKKSQYPAPYNSRQNQGSDQASAGYGPQRPGYRGPQNPLSQPQQPYSTNPNDYMTGPTQNPTYFQSQQYQTSYGQRGPYGQPTQLPKLEPRNPAPPSAYLSSRHPAAHQTPQLLPGYHQIANQDSVGGTSPASASQARTPSVSPYHGPSGTYHIRPSGQVSSAGSGYPSPLSGADARQQAHQMGPRSSLVHSSSHEVLAGKPGYPSPAPKREQKARFTPEDDNLLKFLKEQCNNPKLSWKQIADFFPGRRSGTLQVRYCTKIRSKDNVTWNAESVSFNLADAACVLPSRKTFANL